MTRKFKIRANVEKGVKSFLGLFSNFTKIETLSKSEIDAAASHVLKKFVADHSFESGKVLTARMDSGKLYVEIEVTEKA
jgi:hypothetical protein